MSVISKIQVNGKAGIAHHLQQDPRRGSQQRERRSHEIEERHDHLHTRVTHKLEGKRAKLIEERAGREHREERDGD